MNKLVEVKWTGLVCILVLTLPYTCLGQKDCTRVDCPRLDNCIEKVLEEGECCATCVQRGCTCEGYQYYDCISAGFKNGKVPEGESYLVDSGSTECQCPAGGGRIGCHFIPCPDIPPHCIELSHATEACPHCLRIGCVYEHQKYEAGHSFHMDPCQVCHCPNDGGDLMCSMIPDCSLETVKDPEEKENELLISKNENDRNFPDRDNQFPSNSVPVYLENMSDFEESEDYEYLPEATVRPDAFNTTSAAPRSQNSHDVPHEDNRMELRETLGSYDAESTEERTKESVNVTTMTDSRLSETVVRHAQVSPSETTPNTISDIKRSEKDSDDDKNLQDKIPHVFTFPKLQSNTTTAPENVKEHEVHRQPESLGRSHQSNELHHSHNQRVTSREVSMCCVAGENWASAHSQCSGMVPMRTEPGSTCWSVQMQCCMNMLRQSRCLSGINTARQGWDCGADDADRCDSHTECCKCCALGLQLRAQHELCDPPPALGETCSHTLVTCCEEMGRTNHSTVKEKTHPGGTSPPRRVPEGPEHQAFSLEEVEDTENMVEGLEDVDECHVYPGQLCEHQCVNTKGSYHCTCFHGFVLHPDEIHCLRQVMTDDDNESDMRKEDEVLRATPRPVQTTTTPPPDLTEPCEGNVHCAHYCDVVEGRAHCSCLPGFSLMPDGRSCEDVDECFLSTHSCMLNERCINTVGAFTCVQKIVCSSGYQLRNNVCEDMNECTLGAHSCGPGLDCINTVGSFSCRARLRCPGGFALDSRAQCVDIDECRTVTQPCSPGFNCINTIGSYTCQRKIILCSRGYHASPDGTRCIDINECETGVHRCGEGQTCYNLPGIYRCDCHPGYQYDTFRRMCVDVNECWRYSSRLCTQTCENTPGSYRCSCTSGFTLSSDGKNCEDVNECLSSPCSHECLNIYGSYQCYCRQGYYLREDAHTCEDTDECSQSVGHLCAYKCVNVPGSYDCACPEHGYRMSPNRRSCHDIDECTLGAHNCTAEETCYNIHGGFRCLSYSCPTNYRRISDTRCERISCLDHVGCQNLPLRITYYQLSFQTNTIVPALIFRMGPSPAYSGDNTVISISRGNEDGYFSPRKLNAYTGAIYLQQQLPQPRDFLLDVEMKLWRQGTVTTFIARIYIFITANVI